MDEQTTNYDCKHPFPTIASFWKHPVDHWNVKERLKIRHGMMKSQYLAAGNSKMCFALSLLDVAIIISQHYHCSNKENYEIYWKQTKYVNKVWIIEHFEHDLLIKYYIVAYYQNTKNKIVIIDKQL